MTKNRNGKDEEMTAEEAEQWVAERLAEVLLIQAGIIKKPYSIFEETNNEKK